MGGGKWTWLALWGALVLSQGSPAQALIIAAGTGNTTAPANGAPWNNIGALNDGGCVYLGNGWVLTAGHVYNDDPGQDPVFGTTSYLPDGTSYTIHVPNNPSVNADLVMFHLAVYAELPAVTVASTAPAFNSTQVTAIALGLDPVTPETWWNSSWQVQTGTPAYYGYYANTSSATQRWGTNTVTGSYVGDDGTGTTTNFLYTVFNSSNSNSFQCVSHDSGGGVFYQGTSGWQLAGTILAQGYPTGQPANSAVFGDDTYFANLSTYYSQISAEVLSDALPGDADLDGRVDVNDLTVVLAHYGQTGVWSQGNFITGDSQVDINDLTIVLANYGQTIAPIAPTSGPNAPATVPEPASVLLLAGLVPLVAWAIGRRRRART